MVFWVGWVFWWGFLFRCFCLFVFVFVGFWVEFLGWDLFFSPVIVLSIPTPYSLILFVTAGERKKRKKK